MNKKYFNVPLFFWLIFFLSIPFFLYFSQIDLWVSHLFYNGETFPFKNSFLEKFFYTSIRPLVIFSLLVPIGVTLYNYFKHKNLLHLTKRKLIYIILIITVAPGLIVNFLLKNTCERPRPRDIVEFHGTKPFYPAYTLTNEGKKSFSSAHVAAAFSLVGIALLAQRRRKFWIFLTLSYATGMMLARVAAGAHFFSDVITSFLIVTIANFIFYYYIIEKQPSEK